MYRKKAIPDLSPETIQVARNLSERHWVGRLFRHLITSYTTHLVR